MPNLSSLIGGGAKMPFEQEFLSSGTFTPSAGLLAAGGRVEVLLVGGGGSTYTQAGAADFLGGGGEVVQRIVTVTGPTSVLIGAGGAPVAADTLGTNGGNTSFGGVTVLGGSRGEPSEPGAGGPRGGGGGVTGDPTTGSNPGSHGFGGGGARYPTNGGGNRNRPGQPNTGGGGGFNTNANRAGGSGYVRVRWFE